jgi:hypothetical protein
MTPISEFGIDFFDTILDFIVNQTSLKIIKNK